MDTDILNQGVSFQLRLDLAQTDVLPELQLHQVLLPVDDLHATVRKHLTDIPGTKPRFAITGGAPLSPETHEFIRTCLGIKLVQGYSLTETTCTGTCMEADDMSTGKVGGPMAGIEVKLVSWVEGNYRVTDQPRPRGELIIGGATVARGYFKNDQKTAEDFFDEGGKRWFRTGDIGEMFPDGSVKIIDR